mmetsp:Transcript_134293/g.374293  ORF Transcript_134293/g.374293 Transcript_134293/m.374293 type:complete len:213 (+) Transcript_134293:300-938(+)
MLSSLTSGNSSRRRASSSMSPWTTARYMPPGANMRRALELMWSYASHCTGGSMPSCASGGVPAMRCRMLRLSSGREACALMTSIFAPLAETIRGKAPPVSASLTCSLIRPPPRSMRSVGFAGTGCPPKVATSSESHAAMSKRCCCFLSCAFVVLTWCSSTHQIRSKVVTFLSSRASVPSHASLRIARTNGVASSSPASSERSCWLLAKVQIQ